MSGSWSPTLAASFSVSCSVSSRLYISSPSANLTSKVSMLVPDVLLPFCTVYGLVTDDCLRAFRSGDEGSCQKGRSTNSTSAWSVTQSEARQNTAAMPTSSSSAMGLMTGSESRSTASRALTFPLPTSLPPPSPEMTLSLDASLRPSLPLRLPPPWYPLMSSGYS